MNDQPSVIINIDNPPTAEQLAELAERHAEIMASQPRPKRPCLSSECDCLQWTATAPPATSKPARTAASSSATGANAPTSS